MIGKGQTARAVEMLPGVVRRTLVSGERMLVAEFSLREGSRVPVHQHPYEQVGYVVSGRLRFTIGDEVYVVEAGDGYRIAGGVPHGVEAITGSVAVDIFSPPREDYARDLR